jgi:hypothetical protein
VETSSFRMPVRVRVDHQVPEVEIRTVAEAVRFLEDWPEHRRGPVHRCAMSACRACIGGAMEVEDARRAFESFVHITGLSPPTYSSRLPPVAQGGRTGRPALHSR